ncbi:hypothetical protein [Rhodococcus opacus]|uniref:hypothetical protein n=1 Tax=Rhodococcus opacus TaxID=37919 RepID=UPI001C472E00|nr:hypothetical protein [Rhodococcus opacus]MBV6758418.1 hypothetical protein [Rhodococcus opacus]
MITYPGNAPVLERDSIEWALMLTASKAPKVYGVAGKWGGPRSVYEPMRAALLGEPFDREPSSQIQRDGNHLEPAVRGMWLDRRPGYELFGGEVMFTRDDLGFPAGATPDDVAELPSGERVLVQIKTDRHGMKFGKPGTDEIPLVYYVAEQWALHIARATDPNIYRSLLPVLTPFIDVEEFVVTYNPQHAQQIENVCRDFYLNNVRAGIPPAGNGSEADYDIIRRQHPEIVADSKWQIHPQLALDLCEAQAEVKAAEARVLKAKSDVLDRVGNAREIWCGDQKVGQRQPTKKGVALYPPRKEVDLDQLRADLIDFDQEIAA